MSSFTEPLVISPLGHRQWVLRKAFIYDVGHEGSGESVEVWRDFVSDGGSMPKFTWSFIGHPLEDFPQEYFLHDWLYETGIYSRRKSDKIFFEAMRIRIEETESKKGRIKLQIKRYIIFAFVSSFFGGIAWRRHRRKEAKR